MLTSRIICYLNFYKGEVYKKNKMKQSGKVFRKQIL